MVEERVYEVEGSQLQGNVEQFSKRFLQPGEPAWFESRTGRALAGLDEFNPPLGWKWTSNWKVSYDTDQADQEGWVRDGRVRRRKWTRKREKLTSLSTVQTSSTSSSSSSTTDVSSLIARLETSIQKVAIASSQSARAALMRDSREEMAHVERALSQLERDAQSNLALRPKYRALAEQFLSSCKRLEQVSGPSATLYRGEKEDGSVPSSVHVEGHVRKVQQQQQQMLSHEVAATSALVQERTQALEEINQVTTQVGEMMNQLAKYVDEQGDDVKQVAQNASMARQNVRSGLEQVKKADNYQQEGSSCNVM